jgi:hypothetical protein
MSSLTGLKIEWIDGMKGEDIVDKAVPQVCGQPDCKFVREANIALCT